MLPLLLNANDAVLVGELEEGLGRVAGYFDHGVGGGC